MRRPNRTRPGLDAAPRSRCFVAGVSRTAAGARGERERLLLVVHRGVRPAARLRQRERLVDGARVDEEALGRGAAVPVPGEPEAHRVGRARDRREGLGDAARRRAVA